MRDAGYAHMGVGIATGKDKAEQAAKMAIDSPLLESSIKGSHGILIRFVVSPDVGLEDAELAATLIQNEAHPDANIIWGVGFDDDLEDEMQITIIATGFDKNNEPAPAAKVVKEEPKKAADEDDRWNSLVTPVKTGKSARRF